MVDEALKAVAEALLRRPKDCRGPWIITDKELRAVLTAHERDET